MLLIPVVYNIFFLLLGKYDEELDCHELEEDPLLDWFEPRIAAGGCVVEHHVTDFFPERFFDIVFVLRTENKTLYDRLKARKYNEKKIESNVECEIFQTILEEARECYDEDIVHELASNEEGEIDSNVERIVSWVENWRKDNE